MPIVYQVFDWMRDTEVSQTFMVAPCVNLILPIDFKLHTYINFGKKKNYP